MNYYEIVFNSLSFGLYSAIKKMVISYETDRRNNDEMKAYVYHIK